MTPEEMKAHNLVIAFWGLVLVGLTFVAVAHILHSWMVWATGAGIIVFAMWLVED